MYNIYNKNGVTIVPNVVAEGDKATVLYNGLLFDSGAESVYMHVGFGSDWKQTKDIQMKKTSQGFEANLPVTMHDTLNMAFKDGSDNWDNNSGRNYSFEVLNRQISIKGTRKTSSTRAAAKKGS